MAADPTYTVNEAAALTGRHRNTIRMKIKLGELEAVVQPGKSGEEYRIRRSALIRAGLLPADGPAEAPSEELPGADATAPPTAAGSEGSAPPFAALIELYQRHEQAMFRLGYLQSEMERLKALAETAESLRQDHEATREEAARLRAAVADLERQAAEADRLRQELDAAHERLREMEALRRDLEQLKEFAARQERLLGALEASRKRPWWRFW